MTDFDKFWLLYPKKKSKLDAQKAWKQTEKLRPAIDTVLAKVKALKNSRDWSDYRFIPYPATWLRAGGWDDVVIEKKLEKRLDTDRQDKYKEQYTEMFSVMEIRSLYEFVKNRPHLKPLAKEVRPEIVEYAKSLPVHRQER
jgi:hypothetical protein